MTRAIMFGAAVAVSLLCGESLGKKSDTKVLETLQKYDTTLTDKSFSYKSIRLSKENNCEFPVVFLNGGSGYCGTRGCTMLVLECIKTGYRVMSTTSVAMPPVYISLESTNGLHDIKLYNKNRGLVVLKFDGKRYPSNASMVPKTKKEPSDILLLKEEDVFGK